MPEVTFTETNLLEKKQLTAGWFKLKVVSIGEKPGTSDPESTTWPAFFTVEEGPSAGVPVRKYFTEKQMGDVAEYIHAFTGGVVTSGKKYSLDETVGRSILGYCKWNPDFRWNDVLDFKVIKK
jgi:hypothetical protein